MFGVRDPDFHTPVPTCDGKFMLANIADGKSTVEMSFVGTMEECFAIAAALNAREMARYNSELHELTFGAKA